MRFLENRIPPPVVALMFGTTMWAMSPGIPDPGVVGYASVCGAAVTALVGVFFCVAGAVEFRRAKTTVNPLKPDAASSLVDSGVFRVSRNPMYLGFTLVLLAWVIHLAWPWAMIGVAGYVLYIDRLQIVPEERAMRALFGEEFERYAASVRRWL